MIKQTTADPKNPIHQAPIHTLLCGVIPILKEKKTFSRLLSYRNMKVLKFPIFEIKHISIGNKRFLIQIRVLKIA